MIRDVDYVLNRIADLKHQNQETLTDRWRIRAIMNGGPDGMYAVMAWDYGKGASSSAGRDIAGKMGVDLPTVNLVASGSERLAQVVGRPPTLKPPRAEDEKVREKHQKRIDILEGWDREQRMELHYPQIGRWLPGYSFFVWVLNQRRDRNGDLYPVVELRDPYDVYPGYFGADQQPTDMMVTRRVPLYALKQAYPDRPWDLIEAGIKNKRNKGPIADPRFLPDSNRMMGWEGAQTGIEVIEYYCEDGTHYCIPEIDYRIGHQDSITGETTFAFGKRFAFDKMISQYHHSIGLMAMMAKFNALGLIATEDGTFRETNVYGDMIGGTYKRGRFAVNKLERDARVERPMTDQQAQLWAQIDRLERQLRVSANYDVQQDGTSPNSFATGKGMRELQGSFQANIREYQLIVKHANEVADSKRLRFAAEVYGQNERKYFDMYGNEEKYKPAKAIGKDVRTRRIYGAMATFDDSETIVAGLQLLQGGVIDVETFRENIDNLEDLQLIEERITESQFQDALIGMLQQESAMNPAAKAAVVEIMANPKDKKDILMKYFTPQEPELSPEEEAFAGAGPAAPAGPPPDVTTVLSQLEMGGGVEGGVQTVGRM